MTYQEREALLAACDVALRQQAQRFVRSGLEYDDSLQECRVKLWEVLPRYDGKGHLLAFASTVAHHHLVSLYRTQQNHQRLVPTVRIVDAEDVHAGGITEERIPDLHDRLAEVDGAVWVQQYLNGLGGQEQRVVTSYLQGLTYAEIAVEEGMKRSNKGSMVRICRRAISRQQGEYL